MTENGISTTKERTVAFSGHRSSRIAKFSTEREKLFREVAFDTFVAIESFCIEKGYHTFITGMADGFDLIAAVGGTFYTLKRAVEQKKKFANVCYNRR